MSFLPFALTATIGRTFKLTGFVCVFVSVVAAAGSRTRLLFLSLIELCLQCKKTVHVWCVYCRSFSADKANQRERWQSCQDYWAVVRPPALTQHIWCSAVPRTHRASRTLTAFCCFWRFLLFFLFFLCCLIYFNMLVFIYIFLVLPRTLFLLLLLSKCLHYLLLLCRI